MAPSRQADNGNVFLLFEDLTSPFTWSVSRPAEVQPWEVRFAHPCRARAPVPNDSGRLRVLLQEHEERETSAVGYRWIPSLAEASGERLV